MGKSNRKSIEEFLEYKAGRQISVRGMSYAPTNEQGVVFLFGRLAAKLGFCIESVQVHCPDCRARRRGKLLRIEFEYRASHFELHGHCADDVDMIVCWENDWESRTKEFEHIEIVDLKQYCGVEPRVFSAGCSDRENAGYLRGRKTRWNIPLNAQIGDLVLIYRSYAEPHAICDAWEVVGPFSKYEEGNKEGYRAGMQPFLKCVARFKHPLTFQEMKRDRRTRDLGVVKGKFQNARDISADWPQMYEKILELNPDLKGCLKKYSPD